MQREQQKRDEEANKAANMGTSTGLKVLIFTLYLGNQNLQNLMNIK